MNYSTYGFISCIIYNDKSSYIGFYGNVTVIRHGSLLEWIDYIIGFRRWFDTAILYKS
ncbi:MAG: hypothetical protein HRT57_04920 [Crocinitomicaceae bacterium]|nr:hypothetical protein [Crocinitomicaceae bacterium]